MRSNYEIYTAMLHRKAAARGIPLSGSFELTSRCNLDCRMCYIHKRENDAKVIRNEKTARQWIDLAKECQQAGMLMLLLTGGEPFVRPDFREIYEGCRKLGLMVSINSNGTLIDEDTVAFLVSNPPDRINISLYGASKETYQALCGDAAAYDRVVRAVLGLKKAEVPVKLSFSVTPYNAQDVEAVFAFAKRYDLPIQATSYMFPPVRACELGCYRADRLSAEEAARLRLELARLNTTEEELQDRLTRQLAGKAIAGDEDECQESGDQKIRCRAGSSTFWVTWDWQMRPCGMMTVPSEEITGQGFVQAWTKIHASRDKISVPTQCGQCDMKHVCSQCAAKCFAETGEYTGVPEYLCEMTRTYLELGRQWLKENKQSQQ